MIRFLLVLSIFLCPFRLFAEDIFVIEQEWDEVRFLHIFGNSPTVTDQSKVYFYKYDRFKILQPIDYESLYSGNDFTNIHRWNEDTIAYYGQGWQIVHLINDDNKIEITYTKQLKVLYIHHPKIIRFFYMNIKPGPHDLLLGQHLEPVWPDCNGQPNQIPERRYNPAGDWAEYLLSITENSWQWRLSQ